MILNKNNEKRASTFFSISDVHVHVRFCPDFPPPPPSGGSAGRPLWMPPNEINDNLAFTLFYINNWLALTLYTPVSHSSTQIHPTQSPLGKPCVGIVCGELPTRQDLVWEAPRQPHTKCILFFRPHTIPTQSPTRFYVYFPTHFDFDISWFNPHTFCHINARKKLTL